MKRKVNLYILLIVFFASASTAGTVAYMVNKQLKNVLLDGKQQLIERVIEEFKYFENYLNHLNKQTTYVYKNRVIETSQHLNKKWKHANNIPSDTLKNIAKNIEVEHIIIYNRNAKVIKSTLFENSNCDIIKDDPKFIEFINNLFKNHGFKTYKLCVNQQNNRIYMYSYCVPKNSLYAINIIINLDRHADFNGLLKNRLTDHIIEIIPKVNKIVKSLDLFNADDTLQISLLDNKTRLQLNKNDLHELLTNGELEIKTENGVHFYSIIKTPINIKGFSSQLILHVDFDYTVRYSFALNILIYITIILLIILLLVSLASPAIIDKLFFGKISIINFNLNALRFAKYDILKSFKGSDELSAIAENIVYVKESVVEREKQLKEAKIMAEAADKLKSAFLANMSHEIRTPLNAVVGFSQLLRDTDPTPDDVDRYVGLINSNSFKLLQIINDIIDLSQIESGQLKIVYRPVSLNELFSELYAFAQGKLHGENIVHDTKSIDIFIEHDKITKGECLTTDPYRLKQIMEQLIDNAVKFTCNGEIRIGYRVADSVIELYVSDTGVGIAEENISKIFGRFVQAEDYMTREYGGTGMGLAICIELAHLLGGAITVNSKINKGSTFSIQIPYQTQKTS